jgi:hypothetical protein
MQAFLLCLIAAVAPQNTTITTAANTSISTREITLTVEGGGLVVKYTDTVGRSGMLQAMEVVEIALGSSHAAPNRPVPEEVEILLTTGDLLTGRLGTPSEEGVNLLSPAYGDPLIKFGQIRTILFPVNKAFLPLNLPEKGAMTDIVLTQAGDRAEGTILSISKDGVVYKSKRLDTEVSLPVGKVASVWLIETEPPPKQPAGLHATVVTTDGSSVRGEIQSLQEGILSLKDLYGAVHKIPANLLSGIFMKNGRVVWLSDLSPTEVDEDANFIRGPKKSASDLDFPFQRDRSAQGTKILLAGVEHRKGLGVRARSSLTYSLGGGFKRFQSTVGLDAVSAGRGAILAEVWVDGTKLKEILLKGNDGPHAIDLDMTGTKELRLVVTWAGYGQSDFTDWGSARLIR